MPTQCKPLSFAFQGCQGRRVAAAFDGGAITSNAGVLLLREIDRSVGLLDQVAGCFTDYRDPRLTEHSVGTLVRQRVMGITLGYEDLNDHDQLRHDPVLALLSGKLEGHRKDCAPLAGKSTLNRLEHAPPRGEPGRYHRIGHDADALQAVLLESFIDAWKGGRPSRLVLDIDSTDDEVHGRQEGGFYHGYYNHYCFLPLYITCGGLPLFALLRPGNADPAGGVTGPHRRTAPAAVAGTGDPASGRFLLCPRGDPGLVRGQRRRLRHRPGPELAARRDDRLGAGRRPSRSEAAGPARPPVRRVPLCHTHKLVPQAPGRRQGRAPARQGQPALLGHLAARHLLGQDRLRARLLPEGQHGEHDQGAAARSLLRPDLGVALRRALHGTRLARATAGTLRLKLLKIGARVTVSVRRVKVAMDSAHPSAAAFARVHARLPG